MTIETLLGRTTETIEADAPLAVAHARMRRAGARSLPVLRDGRLVGVLTERALRRAAPSTVPALALHELRELAERTTVDHVMEPVVAAAAPGTSVEDVARLMTAHDVEALPVLEGGRPLGVVTSRDLLDGLATALPPAAPPRVHHVLAVCELGPDDDARVLAAAAEVAGRHGARLTLLHPLGWPGRLRHLGLWPGLVERIEATRTAHALERLRALAPALRGGAVESRVAAGAPATVVVEAARETGADLLVMIVGGRRSAAGERRGWREILRHAPCPVLALPEAR